MAAAYNNRAEIKRAKADLEGARLISAGPLNLNPIWAQSTNNRGELKRAHGD